MRPPTPTPHYVLLPAACPWLPGNQSGAVGQFSRGGTRFICFVQSVTGHVISHPPRTVANSTVGGGYWDKLISVRLRGIMLGRRKDFWLLAGMLTWVSKLVVGKNPDLTHLSAARIPFPPLSSLSLLLELETSRGEQGEPGGVALCRFAGSWDRWPRGDDRLFVRSGGLLPITWGLYAGRRRGIDQSPWNFCSETLGSAITMGLTSGRKWQSQLFTQTSEKVGEGKTFFYSSKLGNTHS